MPRPATSGGSNGANTPQITHQGSDGWGEPELLRLLLRLLAGMLVTACCQNGGHKRHEVAGEIEDAMRRLLARYRRLTEGPETSGEDTDPTQRDESGDEGPPAA